MDKCPNCSKGKIIYNFLSTRDKCPECSFEINQDQGDGPAFFAMSIVGTLSFALALYFYYGLFLSVAITLLLTLVSIFIFSFFFLRLFKYISVYMHYITYEKDGKKKK